MANTSTHQVEQLMEGLDDKLSQLLLCRNCTTPITQRSEKIEIGVSHQFRFTNRAGITYSIGCFRNAPGCTLQGIPSDEDSWFGGYYWQFAACDECNEHLGWYYQNHKERFFFGLIQDRLIEAKS